MERMFFLRKAFISPSKYVQGEGELKNLGFFVKNFGRHALLVASKSGYKRVEEALNETAEKFDVSFVMTDFCGECSKAEISRLGMLAQKKSCDCIIGLGGGKAIDTAKCVANGKPLIIVPTNAATDAPTSHLAVIYNQEGVVEDYAFFQRNPYVILVDTGVIAKSPVRLLVSGMGDALATSLRRGLVKNRLVMYLLVILAVLVKWRVRLQSQPKRQWRLQSSVIKPFLPMV